MIKELIDGLKTKLPDYTLKYEEEYPLIQRDKKTGRFTHWYYDYESLPDYYIFWATRHPIYGKALGRCYIRSELVDDFDGALMYLSSAIPKGYAELVASKVIIDDT